MSAPTPSPDPERFFTVPGLSDLPAYRGWLTRSALRHLIFAAKPRINSKGEPMPTNGLERAIIKIGRKILIDRVEFEAWLEEHRLTAEHASN